MTMLSSIVKAHLSSETNPNPTDEIIEYLRIGPRGGVGSTGSYRNFDIESCYHRHERSHPKAQVTAKQILLSQGPWYETRAVFQGRLRSLRYQRHGDKANRHVTAMIRYSETVLHTSVELGADEFATGHGMVVLNTCTKPYADIIGDVSWSDLWWKLSTIISGWWHAVRTSTGWRVFADDQYALTYIWLAHGDYKL